MWGNWNRRFWNYDFLVLVLIAFVTNAMPICDSTFCVSHDTFQNFTFFHYYYSHLFYDHTLPLWQPYCDWGTPTLCWQVAFLTPSSYGFLVVGNLLGIEDVLLLHKLSIFHELLIYLAGLYLLARKLYLDRRVHFVVCLLGLGTVSWHFQVYYCLRVVYLIPLMLYCWLTYTETERGWWAWAAACLAVLGCVGNLPYFAGIFLLTLTCFAIPFVIGRPKLVLALFRVSATNCLAILATVCVTVCYGAAITYSVAHQAYVDNLREQDGTASMDVFLDYATFSLDDVWASYLFGSQLRFEPNMYVGLATWLFALWACRLARKPVVAALLLPGLLFLAFALSRTFAAFLYHLPLLSYYRHRMYVLSIANLFVILVAGYGLAALLRETVPRQIRAIGVAASLLALTLVGGLSWLPGQSGFDVPDLVSLRGIRITVLAGVVVAMVYCDSLYQKAPNVFRKSNWSNWLFGILVGWTVLDMLFYRMAVLDLRDHLSSETADLFYVRKLEYVPQRSSPAPRTFQSGAEYSMQSQWEQVDPCKPTYRSQVVLKNVADIWSNPNVDRAVSRISGCSEPKLKFSTRVVHVGSLSQAQILLSRQEGLEKSPVLSESEDLVVPDSGIPDRALTPSAFTANRLRCVFDTPTAGYLLYADGHHPDWRAWVNQRPVEVRIANGCFKAVPVPSGANEVVLEFCGRSALHAYAIFALGLVGFVSFTMILGYCVVARETAPVSSESRMPPIENGATSLVPWVAAKQDEPAKHSERKFRRIQTVRLLLVFVLAGTGILLWLERRASGSADRCYELSVESALNPWTDRADVRRMVMRLMGSPPELGDRENVDVLVVKGMAYNYELRYEYKSGTLPTPILAGSMVGLADAGSCCPLTEAAVAYVAQDRTNKLYLKRATLKNELRLSKPWWYEYSLFEIISLGILVATMFMGLPVAIRRSRAYA